MLESFLPVLESSIEAAMTTFLGAAGALGAHCFAVGAVRAGNTVTGGRKDFSDSSARVIGVYQLFIAAASLYGAIGGGIEGYEFSEQIVKSFTCSANRTCDHPVITITRPLPLSHQTNNTFAAHRSVVSTARLN